MKKTTGTLLFFVSAAVMCAQPDYEQVLSRARSALASKDFKGAEQAAQQAIRIDDRRWEGYALAANAYAGEGLYDDAIGMLQMALPRAPEERKPLVRDALQQVRKQMNGAAAGPAPVAATPVSPTPPAHAAAPATQAEIVLWKSIENSTRAEDFQGYLSRYPEGTFASVARSRIEAMSDLERRRREDTVRWVDPATRLSWARQDNGSDVNWTEAENYCRAYKAGGLAGWRLPEIDELAGIFDTSSRQRSYPAQRFQEPRSTTVHVPEGIELSEPIVWSATAKGSGKWLFDFRDGHRLSRGTGSRYFRALCVRSSDN